MSHVTDYNMWTEWVRVESVCVCAFVTLYLVLMLSVLPVLTVVLLHLMPVPLLVLCYYRCKELKEQGLVTFMPDKVQDVLLHRSLLDLLMLIWDLPNLIEYLKRLIYPFFVHVDKTEALMLFQELSPDVAAIMDTKGLVNMLPVSVKKVIVPEALLKDCQFMQPILKRGKPRHRSHASMDLSKDPLPPPIRPVRLPPPSSKSDLKTEVISSSSDSVSPTFKPNDSIDTVISRLRHRVTPT